MANLRELDWLDATALADLVRRGEVTPLELVDAAIDRIERVNPRLNAVVTPMYEIGKQAYELLIGAMEGKFAAPRSLILPVELKLRESISVAR